MGNDIMPAMAKELIHISEAEAVSNFADVLARVRGGAEIVIGDDARPVAVVPPAEPHVRLLSGSLRLAEEHALTATLDGDFARDSEQSSTAIVNRLTRPLGTDPRFQRTERRGDTVEQIVKATGDQ